jgi:hypothetical protein
VQWVKQPKKVVIGRFGVTRGFVRYWRERFADPSLHAGGHGGYRAAICRFTDEGQLAAESLLWTIIKANPMQTKQQMELAMMEHFQLDVSQ